MTHLPISNIVLATGFILVLIGLWGMLTHRNILRIIIGFSLIDTGIHIVIVSIGYVTGGTAPDHRQSAQPVRGSLPCR